VCNRVFPGHLLPSHFAGERRQKRRRSKRRRAGKRNERDARWPSRVCPPVIPLAGRTSRRRQREFSCRPVTRLGSDGTKRNNSPQRRRRDGNAPGKPGKTARAVSRAVIAAARYLFPFRRNAVSQLTVMSSSLRHNQINRSRRSKQTLMQRRSVRRWRETAPALFDPLMDKPEPFPAERTTKVVALDMEKRIVLRASYIARKRPLYLSRPARLPCSLLCARDKARILAGAGDANGSRIERMRRAFRT